MNLSVSETRWKKFGKPHDFVLIGKEIVATASGIYVSFLDLSTRERRIERFDSKERGDGASCLTGHSVIPMFSVVERKPNPKISVFAYPTLRRISRCTLPDKVNGYLSCSFAGTEYLVSLTSFPNFRLIVWLWSTGKHIAALDTRMDNLVQEISCSPNSSHLISQLGVTDGTLAVYQMRACSKIVGVYRVNAPVPKCRVASSSWTPEGNLFVSGEFGDVWFMAMDANQLYSVVKSEKHESLRNKPIVVAYKSGVVLVDANNEIALYKRSSADCNTSWQIVWSIPTFYSIQAAKRCHHRDGLLFHSKSGEIFEINTQHDNVPHLEVIDTDEIEYKALLSVSQRADHVAAVDRLDRFCVFELSTGRLITRLSLRHHGEVLRTDSHPVLPVLASCSITGNCILIDITDASSPKVLNCFHLHGDSLDRIRFSLRGEHLAIGNSQSGRIFIVDKQREGRHADVLGLVEVGGYITDFLVYERTNDRFDMLVLVTANPSMPSAGGDKVIMYICGISGGFSEHATCVIDLSRPYRMLYHCGLDQPLSILCIPSLSKELHQMEIQNDFQDMELKRALFATHQMRNIGIHVAGCRVVTYGYDGLVVIRDSTDLGKVTAIFMPHHRSEGGIKYAVSSHSGETIVSLGRNGDLIASRVRLPEARTKLSGTSMSSVRLSIEDFTSGANVLRDSEEETWLDRSNAARLKAERDQALPLRASVMADLEKIKAQIRELLDINESKPPDARLPISAFDLDRESRRRRIEEARLEREEVRRSIEEECAQREQSVSYLREILWDPLLVKPCTLRSIGGDTMVRNYPLVAVEKINDVRVWDRLSADADEFSYSYDIYNESVDEGNDAEQESTAINANKESSTVSDDEIHEMARKWYALADEDERLCLSGTTTHQWIQDDSVAPMHQLLAPRDSDLEAILKNDAIIENRERKLKMHFNDLFEETRRAKERELKRAKERIDRLRYCASELKTLFGMDSVLEPIDVPTWNDDEIPDYVVTVKDSEVNSKRQSRQGKSGSEEIETTAEDENENRRENDFRTKALERMMDGVLELRWEDEVKKEVPVPECLAKDSSEYTDEDVMVIASYESKVQALQEERERYKARLQAEIAETREALQSDIAAFNDKLEDLEAKKMQIECAILQERLMRCRAIRRYRAKVKGEQEIARFAERELAPATQEAREFAEQCKSLEAIVSELKNRYDSLCKSEKRQEAKFHSEFADLKQSMTEHLFRHYKKRPRLGRLVTTSVTYLTEVARCIACNETSDILPGDCLDFLKAMDSLDATMPGNLPAQINANHWRTMCRLRRAKIELETKVKCCAIEIAEAVQTLSFHQKSMQAAESIAACKKVSLDDMRKSLTRLAEEMEVQLVLKMDQIEVPLRGDPSDYANAVPVTREEILRVNDCIVESGRRKLAAMQKSMRLRKVVSRHEWQHTCEKMMLDDLQQDLRDVREFKITRHVLEFLKCHPVDLDKDYGKKQANLRIFRNRLREALDAEHARLRETKRLMAKWRKKNDKATKEIKSKSSDVEECRRLLDPCRKKEEESRRMRLTAIARRTRLVMKLENNYEQLVALHARLEVLKLRTYPVLQFRET